MCVCVCVFKFVYYYHQGSVYIGNFIVFNNKMLFIVGNKFILVWWVMIVQNEKSLIEYASFCEVHWNISLIFLFIGGSKDIRFLDFVGNFKNF